MISLWESLPDIIKTNIFEFDLTYRIKFNIVIEELNNKDWTTIKKLRILELRYSVRNYKVTSEYLEKLFGARYTISVPPRFYDVKTRKFYGMYIHTVKFKQLFGYEYQYQRRKKSYIIRI
jgi:hypothetical protein